ncbi:MAG: PTS sugar transporter subunit IIA [Nibricoccus sp.]
MFVREFLRQEDYASTCLRTIATGVYYLSCKTKALAANSVVVVRLCKPIEWQSLGDRPVDLVIMLTIREGEDGKAHMEILARLYRLFMRDEFRAALRAEKQAEGLLALLEQSDRPLATTQSYPPLFY